MTLTLANAGMPMLLFTGPVMIIGFPLIVAIERWVLGATLELTNRQAWRTSLSANLVSTLVGVPVTWVILVIIQMVSGGGHVRSGVSTGDLIYQIVMQAPWQPGDDGPMWTVPAAALALHVPFLVASVYIEFAVARGMLSSSGTDRRHLHRTVWIANIATYALLAAFWGIVLWRQTAASI